MSAPLVRFRDVRKRFRLRNRSDSLRDAVARVFRRRERVEPFWALDGVSFDVAEGEVLGLVGPNGAGKSTSLLLAAGVYEPDGGAVEVGGRVSALIELSAGFHPDLSGRENIFLCGALLGLRRREIEGIVEPIAAFADIGKFLESPVRTYSTGMAVRLGFAVAAHVPARILLVDEVLAVGDMEFRARCLRRMAERREEGAAVLFVSHNLAILEQFCDRIVFLDGGKVVADGAPRETLGIYRKHVAEASRVIRVRESAAPQLRRGTGRMLLEDVRIGDGDGGAVAGEPLRIAARWKVPEGAVEEPRIGVAIHTMEGVLCASSVLSGGPDRYEGEGELTVTFPALNLLPGSYEVTVSAMEPGGLVPLDLHQRLHPLRVEGEAPAGEDGIVPLSGRWEVR